MNEYAMNPSSTNAWEPPTPEEEARALLREIVFDCVSGDMRAGQSAVVSASARWLPDKLACHASLHFRALGSALPDFGSLKVTGRCRSKHVSAFPQTRAVDADGTVSFDFEMDAKSASTAVFLVSAEKTAVPMRHLTGRVYAAESLKRSYAADTETIDRTFWQLDPIRPGTLHCFSADGLVRATATYGKDDEGRITVTVYFRANDSLARRRVYWALGVEGRLDREGELELSEQTDKWWFTPVETLVLNDDREFYFQLVALSGEI